MNLQEEALFNVLSHGQMKNSNGEPIKSKLRIDRTVIAISDWPAPKEVVKEMERLDMTNTAGLYIRRNG
jgi:hypothetical protein